VNHLDKVDRKQAEKQKEERRKEKRERAKELEAKRPAFEAAMVADRQLLEERHLANDAVKKAALMELLGQSAFRAPKEPTQCKHGRRKSRCRDCGTGYCQHRRPKSMCKDCGTGHCDHGRQNSKCKDCGAGHWLIIETEQVLTN
jgi:hypothetical protein